jgi:hypothetical protein
MTVQDFCAITLVPLKESLVADMSKNFYELIHGHYIVYRLFFILVSTMVYQK